VGEYLLDDHWIVDAGDHFGRNASGMVFLNVDIEHALELLCRGHSVPALHGSSPVVCVSNTQRNDHFHGIVAIQGS